MAVERTLILVLTLTAVGVGTGAAVTRPLLFRRGSYRSGRWVAAPPRPRDWSRFQGRGPGSAK
jgi:hypothetical protein